MATTLIANVLILSTSPIKRCKEEQTVYTERSHILFCFGSILISTLFFNGVYCLNKSEPKELFAFGIGVRNEDGFRVCNEMPKSEVEICLLLK